MRQGAVVILGLTGPEARLSLLVHLPHGWVLDGEHAEAIAVLIEQRLGHTLGNRGRHPCYDHDNNDRCSLCPALLVW